MKFKAVLFLSLLFSYYSNAAPTVIADNATIMEVGVATGNEDNFYIRVLGGTGSCTHDTNEKLIIFPLTAAGGVNGNNKEVHARLYSAVLAAYMSGASITVSNYFDAGCNYASKLKIRN